MKHPPGLALASVTAALLWACGRSPAAPTPSAAHDPIAGRYTLTIDGGSACTDLPAHARTRTYTATIGAGIVTLSDATFLTNVTLPNNTIQANCILLGNLGCHQFRASNEGDIVRIHMIADHDGGFDNGGQIIERIPPGTWLRAWGTGNGRLDGTTIEALLEGGLSYCPIEGPYRDPCAESLTCKTSRLRLTFTRR